jgi:murein hydrolase activator
MRAGHLIAIALVVTLCAPAPGSTASPKKTEAELRALNERIERMTQQVSRDALERERQSAGLRAAEMSLGQARGELGRLNREYTDRATRRAAMAQSKEQEQRSLGRQREVLAGQLRAAYMIGREEPLKLLLNQRDPLHSGRLYVYYSYFGRARADQIAQI